MRIELEVPDRIWWAAAEEFEKANLTVRQGILLHVVQVAETKDRVSWEVLARRSRVIRLVAQGWTDQRISESTGESRPYIGETRRKAGLKPNRPTNTTEGKP